MKKYGIFPGWVIWLLHILIGLIFVTFGYILVEKGTLSQPMVYLMGIIGGITILYHIGNWLYNRQEFYSLKVPGWIVVLFHVLLGLFLLYVSNKLYRGEGVNKYIAIVFFVLGFLVMLYHIHLWILYKYYGNLLF